MISNGDALRDLFRDFARMEKHGHLAVLDVRLHKAEHQQVNQNQVRKGKEKEDFLREYKQHLAHKLQQAKLDAKLEAMLEAEWEKFHQKHQSRFQLEHKHSLFQDFGKDFRYEEFDIIKKK
eukprot:TRINITY_DN4152_c0_g1_i19.p4 TRINITY_DN4152_c0_g1~~TRINITY_DN4152_c0_g1_i19.p4  ORF type:complete len:121 (-),score=25.54 TRINITY_DN4152_c0_g1_i19:693-1055(-)